LCGKEEEKEEERGGKVGGRVSHGYYQYAPHHDTSRPVRIFGEDHLVGLVSGLLDGLVWSVFGAFTEVIYIVVYVFFDTRQKLGFLQDTDLLYHLLVFVVFKKLMPQFFIFQPLDDVTCG
jgi:hypothetical protein